MFDGLSFTFSDAAQIALLYLAIYWLLKHVKDTRSGQVLLGFGILSVLLISSTYLLRFDVLARIVYFLIIYLALSMVVVFQQEIRRFLALVGGVRLFTQVTHREMHATAPDVLAECVMQLAAKKMGALIAIERGISLRNYEDTGVMINADIGIELLVSIFTPPLPLHDGGIIIRNGRITAAHCLFPVSNQSELISSGMRHRAAVGLSEDTDAVVVLVSEETGRIAIAHNGRIHRYDAEKTKRMVQRWVRKAMPGMQNRDTSVSGWMVAQGMKYFRLFKPVQEKTGGAQ